MDAFLKLATELLLIICIQSILEMMCAGRRQSHFIRVIFLAGYVASLGLVLNFITGYFLQMLPRIF